MRVACATDDLHRLNELDASILEAEETKQFHGLLPVLTEYLRMHKEDKKRQQLRKDLQPAQAESCAADDDPTRAFKILLPSKPERYPSTQKTNTQRFGEIEIASLTMPVPEAISSSTNWFEQQHQVSIIHCTINTKHLFDELKRIKRMRCSGGEASSFAQRHEVSPACQADRIYPNLVVQWCRHEAS